MFHLYFPIFCHIIIGLYTGLTPLYLSEIGTADIRGALGTLHQLGVTIGILLSQVLGFPEIFGNGHLWHVLLGEIWRYWFELWTPNIRRKQLANKVYLCFRGYNSYSKFNMNRPVWLKHNSTCHPLKNVIFILLYWMSHFYNKVYRRETLPCDIQNCHPANWPIRLLEINMR